MAKATWVKIDGVWKQIKNVWINVGGVWKQKTVPKGVVGSVWKEFVSYLPEIQWITTDDYSSYIRYGEYYGSISIQFEEDSDIIQIISSSASNAYRKRRLIDTKTGKIVAEYNIVWNTSSSLSPSAFTVKSNTIYAMGSEYNYSTSAYFYYNGGYKVNRTGSHGFSYITIGKTNKVYFACHGIIIYDANGKELKSEGSSESTYYGNIIEDNVENYYYFKTSSGSSYSSYYKVSPDNKEIWARSTYEGTFMKSIEGMDDTHFYAFRVGGKILKILTNDANIVWTKSIPSDATYLRKYKDKFIILGNGHIYVYDKEFNLLKDWTSKELPFINNLQTNWIWNIDKGGNIVTVDNNDCLCKISGLMEV